MSDGTCYYCNESTESHAGDPGLWPVMLCHADDPGKVKHHHAHCISERLATIKQLRAKLKECNAYLRAWEKKAGEVQG